MDRFRRKILPDWPNPQSSLGFKLRKMGKWFAWLATGTARERYRDLILPELDEILKGIEPPQGAPFLIKLYMVGRDEEGLTANPIVTICCPVKAICEDAIALVREAGILEKVELSGFGLGYVTFPLESRNANVRLRLLGSEILPATPGEKANISTVDVYGVPGPRIGRKLRFIISSDSTQVVRDATGGPIVRIGEDVYQLAAAHATQPTVDSDSWGQYDARLGQYAFDDRFDDQSDVDDEDDDDETILSRASLTSEESSAKGEDGSSDGLETSGHSNASDSSDRISVSSPPLDGHSYTPEPPEVPTKKLKTQAEEGYFFLGSISAPLDREFGLDYVLFKLPLDEINMAGNKTAGSDTDASFIVHDIADFNDDMESTEVFVVTSRGLISGSIYPDSSMVKFRGSPRLQRVLMVLLSEDIKKGDSGSVVIDARTGNLYGHVIMGAEEDTVIYIVPATDVFDDLKTRFGQTASLLTATVSIKVPEDSDQTALPHNISKEAQVQDLSGLLTPEASQNEYKAWFGQPDGSTQLADMSGFTVRGDGGSEAEKENDRNADSKKDPEKERMLLSRDEGDEALSEEESEPLSESEISDRLQSFYKEIKTTKVAVAANQGIPLLTKSVLKDKDIRIPSPSKKNTHKSVSFNDRPPRSLGTGLPPVMATTEQNGPLWPQELPYLPPSTSHRHNLDALKETLHVKIYEADRLKKMLAEKDGKLQRCLEGAKRADARISALELENEMLKEHMKDLAAKHHRDKEILSGQNETLLARCIQLERRLRDDRQLDMTSEPNSHRPRQVKNRKAEESNSANRLRERFRRLDNDSSSETASSKSSSSRSTYSSSRMSTTSSSTELSETDLYDYGRSLASIVDMSPSGPSLATFPLSPPPPRPTLRQSQTTISRPLTPPRQRPSSSPHPLYRERQRGVVNIPTVSESDNSPITRMHPSESRPPIVYSSLYDEDGNYHSYPLPVDSRK